MTLTHNTPSRADNAPRPDARSARRRVCVLNEGLATTPDEGITKFAVELGNSLSPRAEVMLVATRGSGAGRRVKVVGASRTFLSLPLRRELKRQRPEIVFYVPSASTTFMAFVRSRMLRAYCPSARVIMLGLQPRRHSRLQQRLLRHLAPSLVCVGSADSQRYLERLGCPTALVASGVDAQRFQPVTAERRQALRAQFGLAVDKPVVLHVGHLKPGRGIRVLADLAATGECQAVLVASSSTTQDGQLADELRRGGVRVLTEYLPHVEHVYQLADCYVFPVESAENAIEAPLSVLEALACDLPVVSTRFGGLPRLFEGPTPGLVFVDSAATLVSEALRVCRTNAPAGGGRALIARYSWEAIATGLLDQALARTGRGGTS